MARRKRAAKPAADEPKSDVPPKEVMSDDRLRALIAREIATTNNDRATQGKKNSTAMAYYQGDVSEDLPSMKGRSKLVSTDVADNMGWIMPQLMRLFTSSSNFCQFSPIGMEDDQWARDATLYINWLWWGGGGGIDGYRVVHNGEWDSCLTGNGVIKTFFDATPVYEVSYHTGLTEDEYAELTVDEDELEAADRDRDPDDGESRDDKVEVLEKTERVETIMVPRTDQATGVVTQEKTPRKVWDCRIRRLKRKGTFRSEAIPSEDYLKTREAKTCAEATFQAHRMSKTRSDLVKMGFDRNKVYGLSTSAGTDDGETERMARDPLSDDVASAETAAENEVIDLYECYYKIDIDDNGIAETVRAYYAGDSGGGTLLDWDEWEDETPFDDIPFDLIPHKWEARSLADESMDIQLAKTALVRGAMDNLYAHVNPTRFVAGNILNPDALFNPQFGDVVFGDESTKITNLNTEFVADKPFMGLEYWDRVIQRRTGIGMQGNALDADALQKQTATASQIEHDSSFSQVEIIARNAAELGWKPIIKKLLRLVIKHRDGPQVLRLHGKPVEVDPRHWNADMDVTVNTGLGTGSRDRDVAMLQVTLNNQFLLAQKCAEAGLVDKALMILPYVSRALQALTEATGLRNPDHYFPNITEEDVQQLQQQLAQQANQPTEAEKVEKLKQDGALAKIKAEAEADVAKMRIQEEAKMNAAMGIEKAKQEAAILIEQAKAEAARIKNAAELEADLITKQKDRETQEAIKIAEIASKERIEFAKMASAERIAAMSRDVAMEDDTTDEEGRTVPGKAITAPQLLAQVAASISALMEAQNAAAQAALAPKRVVRDPMSGAIMGTEVDDSFFDDGSPDDPLTDDDYAAAEGTVQ